MRHLGRISFVLLCSAAVAATPATGLALAAAQTHAHVAAAAAEVKTGPGHMLVTASGMTLYVFTHDKMNQSVCTGKCATIWPPLLVSSGTKVAATMPGIVGTFGVAPRANGTKQLTFDGAPLYTFAKDTKAGQMAGQGLLGIWWVAAAQASATKPAANALVKLAPARLLTNDAGLSLYIFSLDKKNKSDCAGPCAKLWPPLVVTSAAKPAATMAPIVGTFAEAARGANVRQLTYDGAPLYTWVADKKPGQLLGQGFKDIWWAVIAPVKSTNAAGGSSSGGW